MRIFFSNGVRHHHEQPVADLAKRLPALLSVFNAVLQGHEEWIPEHLGGVFKADAVLALIGEVLGLIPFKTDSAHYNSIITKTQLHNEKPLWLNRAGWE